MARLLLIPLVSLFGFLGTGPLEGGSPLHRPTDQRKNERELHVVGFYEGFTKSGGKIHGGKALISVKRPGKRVTLVLTAYDSVTWDVSAEPDTVLEKVILCGYHRQAVKGLPKEVEVTEAFREDGKGVVSLAFYVYRLDSPQFRMLTEALRQNTGLNISSFHGAYRAEPGAPVIVDRVQNDPRLSADWPTPTPAADLPKLNFKAVHLTPGLHRHETQLAYGDFTLHGPKIESLKPAPKGVSRLTFDPVEKKFYGIAGSGIAEVDLEKKSVRKIEESLDVPRISWPTDVTFDPKRKRLILLTRGILYAHEPATGNWSALADGLSAAAITYSAKDDALYAIRAEREGVPSLLSLNAEGAVVNATPLSGPIVPGLLPDGPGVSHAQLVAVEGQIVLMASTSGRRDSGEETPRRAYIYIIDPESGKATLTWKGK
jgi:hypothetical protein